MNLNLKPLYDGTLQTRSFSDLGLKGRKLHVWCELTGFTPVEHDKRKWRLFSPADLLRLTTLEKLKDHTGLTIKDNASLIDFLTSDSFVENTIGIWLQGYSPVLCTNMDSVHKVQDNPTPPKDSPSPFWGTLSLISPLALVWNSIRQSGNEAQQQFVLTATSDRMKALEQQIASAPTQDDKPHAMKITKGKRLLETDVDEENNSPTGNRK